jgi:hypothetical protein
MNRVRLRVRPKSYLLVYAVIASLLVALHQPLLDVPFYWDEVGQFIPASLDLFQTGSWIPHSTLPNAHPPGVMAWLAGFWHIFGYSIAGTRVAMLLMASAGATFVFLLAIELSRGAPGAPAFTALSLLCVSPLFYAQSMLAQLDMPAMCFTVLALLLFLQDHFRSSALACVALVLIKETGVVAPALFGCWLLAERRLRPAAWYLLPLAAICLWLVTLKQITGHWFGNHAFARYNLFDPLHPLRLGVALLRRTYYLFIGTGHFIGTAALVWAFRRMPLLRSRSSSVAGAFVALHTVIVSMLGGAVLERYLLPALPIVYIAFAASFRAMLPHPRKWATGAIFACLVAANFINPPYPFPFENNLAFINFVELQKEAAEAVNLRPGTIASAFPMADALRRTEYGFVTRPRSVTDLAGFHSLDIAPLRNHPPGMLLVYDTAWDPMHLLDREFFRSLFGQLYGYDPPMTPTAIASALSMRVEAQWTRRGLSMTLLVRDPK